MVGDVGGELIREVHTDTIESEKRRALSKLKKLGFVVENLKYFPCNYRSAMLSSSYEVYY